MKRVLYYLIIVVFLFYTMCGCQLKKNNNPAENATISSSSIDEKETNLPIPSNPISTSSTPTPVIPTPIPTPNPTPVVSTPTPLLESLKMREEILNNYGITIYFGNLSNGYSPGKYLVTPLSGEEEVLKKMKDLRVELDKYPSGFFFDFKNDKINLSIYLASSVEDDRFVGLIDREYMDDVKITINVTDYLWDSTIHHEIMHLIDYFIELKTYPVNHYNETEKFNPAEFQYGQFNIAYDMDRTNKKNVDGKYFVTNYGQTNVREDRATMFAEMQRFKYFAIDFKKESSIRLKALIIDEQIRTYFPSAKKSDGYWKNNI